MPSKPLHEAGDLPPDIQQAVARPALTGRERVDLAKRFKKRIDKTAANLKDVPDAELDELIDEAVDHVRHHRA